MGENFWSRTAWADPDTERGLTVWLPVWLPVGSIGIANLAIIRLISEMASLRLWICAD